METHLKTLVKLLIWISGDHGYELELILLLQLVQHCRFAIVLFLEHVERD